MGQDPQGLTIPATACKFHREVAVRLNFQSLETPPKELPSFSGAPGGGSTYEAVLLGQCVLLSDLPVNREIDDGDVRFFPPGDHVSLSKLMEVALEKDPIESSPEELVSKSNAGLKRYGEAIWASVTAAIERFLNR
jgi:hypothetical protein